MQALNRPVRQPRSCSDEVGGRPAEDVTGMREHHSNWATWTFLWDQAVQRQADRILGAEFEDAQVDVMLFADALRNVLRGAERVLGRRHQAVQAFKTEVPDAEHVRNIFEHFDAYVEGKGHRQQDKSIGPEDWKPLHSKVGDDFYVVGFGPYRLEVGPAREASARLLAATLNADDAG